MEQHAISKHHNNIRGSGSASVDDSGPAERENTLRNNRAVSVSLQYTAQP